MGTNEMRSLRLGDVNLFHRTASVPPDGSKNRARTRTIPLISGEALWAAEQLIERARKLGATSPLHYLFPFRRPPLAFDPTRSMTVTGIRPQWEEVRKESGLLAFTPYHTRHTALTLWAEGGMRLEEMMALAGHVSPRMTRHYARISEGVLRKAMESARFNTDPQPPRRRTQRQPKVQEPRNPVPDKTEDNLVESLCATPIPLPQPVAHFQSYVRSSYFFPAQFSRTS